MYNISPKLKPQIIKQQDEDEDSCCTLRCWLLVWAILRLIVSVLWTIILGTVGLLQRLNEFQETTASYEHFQKIIRFDILVQLVEFGMIITFITAGIKKSANLYRVYYHYCILTLIIYSIAMILCAVVGYDEGHFFGEIYITYHLNELLHFYLAFLFAGVLVVGLEILLICLIKKLINKYSITTSYQNI